MTEWNDSKKYRVQQRRNSTNGSIELRVVDNTGRECLLIAREKESYGWLVGIPNAPSFDVEEVMKSL